MKFEKMHWLGIGAAIVGAVVAFLLLGRGNWFNFILIIFLIIGSLPFMISFLLGEAREKEREEKFLAFVRDLVETVRSGTPISKAIVNLRNRNYGSLSSYIKKLANQLTLGITLTKALDNFARDANSRVISRSVSLISEAEKAGGNIDVILESVANSVNQIDQLRKERKAAVSNLVTQGYMIFFVFIIIMLVLEFKILPLVSDLGGTEGMSISTKNIDPDSFSMPLFAMLLVQSFFAGLVIGKISEGSIKNGFKHSFILLALTLLITTGAKALFK